MNITVVTITVVDTVRSEFTRGTRAATILPCNSSLTFTNAAAALFAGKKNILNPNVTGPSSRATTLP